MSTYVLVVDDEPLIRWAIAEMLAGSDISTITAADATTAIRSLTEPASKIDVVLLDYHLPDARGFDVLARIRNLSPDTPVIVMTGHCSAEINEGAMALGAVRVVCKPFDAEQLATAVHEVHDGAAPRGCLPDGNPAAAVTNHG